MKSFAVVACLACGPLLAVAAHAADWPQWHGLNRDGKSPETGLLTQWPADGLKPLWVAEGLGKGLSAVTVADTRIYATGMGENNQGALSAYDLAGKLLWRTPYGPEWDQTYPGARSSPTVDGDRVFMLSSFGRLICFNSKTGAIEWTEDVAKKFGGESPRCGFVESVLTYADNVICTPGGEDASLVALDKKTGQTVWTTKGFSDQSAYCSPILIVPQASCLHSSEIVAQASCLHPPEIVAQASCLLPKNAGKMPALQQAGTRLIVTITARHLVGIDPETGTVVWSQPFDTEAEDPNHSVSPAYQDGYLYATSGHRDGGVMYKLSPDGKQATQLWADKTLNTLHGGVLALDGYLYGTNSKEKWVCLDIKTGAVMYEAPGVGMGSLAYADGMLYCYGEKGTLALVKASPKAYDIISSFKITQGAGQHWAHPVISGGRLYIRHGDALIAFSLRS